MNIRDISKWTTTNNGPQPSDHCHTGHGHFGQRNMSRRQFGRSAALATVAGATIASGWWRPGLAKSHESVAPVPTPGGSPALGGSYHVFGPAAFDPPDAEPITITDFNGFVGLAYISGNVTQTTPTETMVLPFNDSDMRFMKGTFRGQDGRIHRSAFAFV